MLRITGTKAFYEFSDLCRKDSIPNDTYETCVFENCGDIHPFQFPNKKPSCNTVVFLNCDKNFVYYWRHLQHIQNKPKNFVLISHPCERAVFSTLFSYEKEGMNIFLIEHHMDRYRRYGVHFPLYTIPNATLSSLEKHIEALDVTEFAKVLESIKESGHAPIPERAW